MLMLLAISELLQTLIKCIRLWFTAPLRLHRSNKLIQRCNKSAHRHTPQKPEWLKHEIIRLKARMPHAGCRTISDICNRRYAASHHITIGKTCVHQILQRHQYEIQILRRKLKHATPKPVARNLIWALDLTGKTDTQGKLHALLGIIDHGSRALLNLQALHNKTTHTLINCLHQTIHHHGKPKIIRTDNEGMFTSRAFSIALKKLGIRHQRTTPGCPWQNGRIERLFGSLKEKLDQRTYTPRPQAGMQEGRCAAAGYPPAYSLRVKGQAVRDEVREQINTDLGVFRHWYNHVRPHQNLDGRKPMEAWNDINPYTKPPKQEQWFEAWDGLLAGYELKY